VGAWAGVGGCCELSCCPSMFHNHKCFFAEKHWQLKKQTLAPQNYKGKFIKESNK
jgi:hypothetical protein